MKLISGEHYWFQWKVENLWRVCYIGEDPDENQYLHHMIGGEPWLVSNMNLSCFEFIKINQPVTK